MKDSHDLCFVQTFGQISRQVKTKVVEDIAKTSRKQRRIRMKKKGIEKGL